MIFRKYCSFVRYDKWYTFGILLIYKECLFLGAPYCRWNEVMSEVCFNNIKGRGGILIVSSHESMTVEAGWWEHRSTLLFSTLRILFKMFHHKMLPKHPAAMSDHLRGRCFLGLTILLVMAAAFLCRTTWSGWDWFHLHCTCGSGPAPHTVHPLGWQWLV